jgi:CRISPR-associated protein Cas1
MTDRIVEIAYGPARLRVHLEQLVIERDGQAVVTTPIAEIAALVLSTPQVQFTQAVLAEIASAGGSVVVCDAKHSPAAMVLPLQTHFIQTERFARQAQLSEPRRKRLWQQMVRAKIRAQGRLLEELHNHDAGIASLAERVRSGDPENIEAQAARRYWPRVFGDPHFHRGRMGPDQNAHLNYGYAVLRAAVARAVCGAGLHPSFGLKHRNRYDPFCLAADVMEPFRPVVDRAVALWVREHDPAEPLDSEAKGHLIAAVQARYEAGGEKRTLFDWLARTAASLAYAMEDPEKRIEIAELGEPCPGD